MDLNEKIAALKTAIDATRADLAKLPYNLEGWAMLTQAGQIGALASVADALRTASEQLQHVAASVEWIAPPPITPLEPKP